jgi:hypothetical protein
VNVAAVSGGRRRRGTVSVAPGIEDDIDGVTEGAPATPEALDEAFDRYVEQYVEQA